MKANICEEFGCGGIWRSTLLPYMAYTDNGYDTVLVGPCNEFSDPNAQFIQSRGSQRRWAASPQVSNNSFNTLPVASGQSLSRCIDYASRLPWGQEEPQQAPAPGPAPTPGPAPGRPAPARPEYGTVSTQSFMQFDWRLIAAAALVLGAIGYAVTRQ